MNTSSRRISIKIVVELVLIAVFVVVGIAVARYFITHRPRANRAEAHEKPIPVEVVAAEPVTTTVKVQATGIVKASRESTLQAEVGGAIIAISDQLAPGSMVRKGDMLARIDDRDRRQAVAELEATLAQNQAEITRYTAAIEQARFAVEQQEKIYDQRVNEVAQVENDLVLEEAKGEAARQEFELIRGDVTTANRALVLREPQLQSARTAVASARAAQASAKAAIASARAGVTTAEANLKSAQAAVKATESKLETARLNLARTTITAPYDALILERSVAEGSYVNGGTAVASMVATDEYWVEVSVPVTNLTRIRTRDHDGAGSLVEIQGAGWGTPRQGEVLRSLGKVESQGQLARILVSVKDPLGLQDGAPALLLNTFVSVMIDGEELKDVYPVPNDAIRNGKEILIAALDDKLSLRPVDIIWQDQQHAYVNRGVIRGERIIISDVPSFAEGTLLKVQTAADPQLSSTPQSMAAQPASSTQSHEEVTHE